MIAALIFALFFCLFCITLLLDADVVWKLIAFVGVVVSLFCIIAVSNINTLEEKKSMHRQEVILWAVERPEYKSFKEAEAAYYKEIEAKKWEDEKGEVLEQKKTSH